MHEAYGQMRNTGMEKEMRIAVMTFRLHAPWVHSLKEKRMNVVLMNGEKVGK